MVSCPILGSTVAPHGLPPFLKATDMSIGKTKRFNVFKRDGFRCMYCGKTPPGVILEVDHIIPKSKGGTDDMGNLVTSCFDCNRGKGDKKLSEMPESFTENYERLKEQEEQIVAYNKLTKKIRDRKLEDCKLVIEAFNMHYPDIFVYDKFIHGSLLRILEKLDLVTVIDAMHYSCSRIPTDFDSALSYFCGVCWKKINGEYNG